MKKVYDFENHECEVFSALNNELSKSHDSTFVKEYGYLGSKQFWSRVHDNPALIEVIEGEISYFGCRKNDHGGYWLELDVKTNEGMKHGFDLPGDISNYYIGNKIKIELLWVNHGVHLQKHPGQSCFVYRVYIENET